MWLHYQKLRCNPVKAVLSERPENWEWSSFRHYATGAEGRVEIESECPKARTSGREIVSNCGTAPLKPKEGLSGPPADLRKIHLTSTGQSV